MRFCKVVGYNCRSKDGEMFVMKTQWYANEVLRKYRLNAEYQVWSLILENRLKDLYPVISKEKYNELKDFETQLWKHILAKAKQLAESDLPLVTLID